jgi:hypothetical protein
MNYINLTPHVITVYAPNQFINLAQTNPTTWVADGVDGDAILSLPPTGKVARIDTTTALKGIVDGIPIYDTTYGDIGGLPDNIGDGDILIVSLPTVSNAKAVNHPLTSILVSPYQVVRLASNTSISLGCTGFTR